MRLSCLVFDNVTGKENHAHLIRACMLAGQLNKPALLKITFHTIRHWKATMLYHQTKDILYVMKFLGHKNIRNTLIYTQLIEFGAEEEYHVKVARTLKEACELAEAGFDYITEIDEAQVFRKRK